MTTLYERLGGAPAIDAAVDIFYRKMLSDNRVNYFFDNTDMDKCLVPNHMLLELNTF